jgi:hypothetical protein
MLVGKHQAAINSSMNNCGTKHRVMLPTSKLNSSDSQVSGAGIFLLPLQERVTPALFKNVMSILDCFNISDDVGKISNVLTKQAIIKYNSEVTGWYFRDENFI